MGKISTTGSAGGATGSYECTARLSDIPAGLKAVTADSGDEAGVGTMTMTGNAQAGHVLAGETFYTNDYKTKQTGTMTVGSLLSFSVAAYSGKRVLAKWQNPNQAAGKPYSGVMIRYSTNGYPGVTGGTQIYKGAGNNTAAGGWTQAFLDMPALNRTYYFSCVPYVTCSAGEMLGAPINFTCATGADLWLTFTAGQNYTVPAGYTLMDAFAVGGGGTSSNRRLPEYPVSSGGGGGHTTMVNNIEISSGEILNIVVGGHDNPSGVNRYGTSLATANPGNTPISDWGGGGYGGSGGGNNGSGYATYGGAGGSDGGNGWQQFDPSDGPGSGPSPDSRNQGQGQKSTTRAWGSPTGTIYAGGGGGGNYNTANNYRPSGGAGGGGSGAANSWTISGENGAPNTGGGAGGGYSDGSSHSKWWTTYGGSGIVLLHLH